MTLTKPPIFDVQDEKFDKKIVQAAFHEHGAVVLSNLHGNDDGSGMNWSNIAASVPHLLFEPNELLLKQHRADAVHVEHERIGLQGHPLLPHSDGYIWGDHYPDLVLLVCEQPASGSNGGSEEATDTDNNGAGANFILDGYSIISKLKDTTRQLLETTLVDHTEYSDTSYAAGAKSVVPVLRYRESKQQSEGSSSTPSWWKEAADKNVDRSGIKEKMYPSPQKRLCWRRMINKDYAKLDQAAKDDKPPYISLWQPVDQDEKSGIQDALYELDLAIRKEATEAMRFTLQRGQAMIVDNYRMLHARDQFFGTNRINQRRMWRVWSWTNQSMGLPPEMTKQLTTSDTASEGTTTILPPAGILEAEQTIKAHG